MDDKNQALSSNACFIKRRSTLLRYLDPCGTAPLVLIPAAEPSVFLRFGLSDIFLNIFLTSIPAFCLS